MLPTADNTSWESFQPWGPTVSRLGIYWIASAVVRTIQQLVINKFLSKKSMDELIEENIKKAAKKREKKDADTYVTRC